MLAKNIFQKGKIEHSAFRFRHLDYSVWQVVHIRFSLDIVNFFYYQFKFYANWMQLGRIEIEVVSTKFSDPRNFICSFKYVKPRFDWSNQRFEPFTFNILHFSELNVFDASKKNRAVVGFFLSRHLIKLDICLNKYIIIYSRNNHWIGWKRRGA